MDKEKFQSNPEIAGSPQEISLGLASIEIHGGRTLEFPRGRQSLPKNIKLECRVIDDYQESDCYEISWIVKGKMTQTSVKVPRVNVKWKRMWVRRQPGCWLKKQPSIQECVIAHWSRGPAPKMSGAETRHRSREPKGW